MRTLHLITIRAKSHADFIRLLGTMLDCWDSPRHVERFAERTSIINELHQMTER